jgi:TPR repeat protein
VADVTALGAEQGAKTESEERSVRPSAQSSPQAQQSTMPELKHVPSEQSKAAATSVPWRIIAGGVTILGAIAVVAVLPPRSPVAPQPALADTPQPALQVAPQDASTMFDLGKRYENGDGVALDYGKAREWFGGRQARGREREAEWPGGATARRGAARDARRLSAQLGGGAHRQHWHRRPLDGRS